MLILKTLTSAGRLPFSSVFSAALFPRSSVFVRDLVFVFIGRSAS
jgi:hypothetical protein